MNSIAQNPPLLWALIAIVACNAAVAIWCAGVAVANPRRRSSMALIATVNALLAVSLGMLTLVAAGIVGAGGEGR